MSEPKTTEETGWLIELRQPKAEFISARPAWWGDTGGDVLGWTEDHAKAVRFARKQDAEMVIADIGWTEAFATEHMWS